MGTWRIESECSYLHGEPCRSETFCVEVENQEDKELYLDPSYLLWPGFIDFHAHLALEDSGGGLGVNDSELIRLGVFGAADAGTFGWQNTPELNGLFEIPFKRWISLLPTGLATYPITPRYQGMTSEMEEQIHQAVQLSKNNVLGIKIRLGQHDHLDDEMLLADGVRIAENLGIGLMVHFTGTFLPLATIVAALRPGDVLTHIFHGRRGSILADGHLDSAISDAVYRGILLDVGHGSSHFSWPVFLRARAEGLLADIISTDVTRYTINQSPLFDLPFVCSKLVSGGLDWDKIYQSTVEKPLEYLGLEIPNRSVVVLRKNYESVIFGDSDGNLVEGSCRWDPALVIYRGHLISNEI